MDMLAILAGVERDLPQLLLDEEGWDSRYVTYEKPHVERLFRPYGACRINLHRIGPCEAAEAFFHPHPWPSAMVLDGPYEMVLGYGQGTDRPVVASRLHLPAGTRYEMTDPDLWHSVRPRGGPVLSLMVSGPPWGRKMPVTPTHPCDLLGPAQRASLFAAFRERYPVHGLG